MIVKGFKNVFKRELRQMFSRPIYLFATILIMGFCYTFFLSLMQQGLPQKLPVAVVDLDNSTISKRTIRELNATPSTEIVLVTGSYLEARELMQSGDIFGFIVIPKKFYKDILTNKIPEVPLYYNNSYLIAGSLVYKDLLTLSVLGSAAYERAVIQKRGVDKENILPTIQPIVIDKHQMGNPWVNYSVFLVNGIIPGIFQLTIIMMTIFVIGFEIKNRTSKSWLKKSNYSLAVGLAGKLAPYTILFIIIGLSGNVLIFKTMNFPMNGSFILFSFGTILLVLAAQAVGIFIIGLLPVLRVAISIGAIFSILSVTYTGFTFPIEAMPPMAQGASLLFPVRHYYLFYVKEALLGAGPSISIIHLCAIMCFLILPFVVYYRLKEAAIKMNYPIK